MVIKKYNFFVVSILFFLVSCTSDKKVEVTTEFIINENWEKEWASPIVLQKLRVKKDSIINGASDLTQVEILSKLEIDSSARWLAFANTSKKKDEIYRTKKVYFTKDNGFDWHDNVTNKKISIFGRLEVGTWYRFSGLLKYHSQIYSYVDSSGQVHSHYVNVTNW